MAKSINVLLALKDQFTSPLQKATKNIKTMDRHLEKAKNKIRAFGNSVKKSMVSVAKYTAVGFGALTAGAVLFAKQSIELAKDQLRVEKLLETTMKRTSKATDSQIQAIKDEASALQSVGVIGDEVALAGANQLAVYGLRSDQIKKLMPNLNDMIAKEKGLNGTQEDSVAMADVIGKALAGKTKGLLKYGVTLSKAEEKLFKTMNQEQRLNLISEKLTKSIGGTNKALRETDEGKIVAAKNAWGDMKEELGKKLLPYLGKFAEWFESKIPTIQNWILSIADKINELVVKAQPYIILFKDLIGSMWEKAKPAITEFCSILLDGATFVIGVAKTIIDNWDLISPIVYTVVGAITAYNAVMLLCSAYTTTMVAITKVKTAFDIAQTAATGSLTVAQWALNVAMNANPIGLIITAIGLLVAGIWILIKKFKVIKATVMGFWEKLDNNPIGKIVKLFLKFGNPIGLVINALLFLKDIIVENWDRIKNFFMPVWDALVEAFNWCLEVISNLCSYIGDVFMSVWDALVVAWNWVKEGIASLCDTLSGIFMPIWDTVTSAINAILEPLKAVKNFFGGIIDSITSWNDTDIEDKTVNITENKTTTYSSSAGSGTTDTKAPRHALGTSYFKGGVTGINEGGRNETAVLPSGTKILSHEEGKKIENNNNGKSITVNLTIQGNVIGEEEQMEKYGNYIGNKILKTLGNM